jgi:hypothetical protein
MAVKDQITAGAKPFIVEPAQTPGDSEAVRLAVEPAQWSTTSPQDLA